MQCATAADQSQCAPETNPQRFSGTCHQNVIATSTSRIARAPTRADWNPSKTAAELAECIRERTCTRFDRNGGPPYPMGSGEPSRRSVHQLERPRTPRRWYWAYPGSTSHGLFTSSTAYRSNVPPTPSPTPSDSSSNNSKHKSFNQLHNREPRNPAASSPGDRQR